MFSINSATGTLTAIGSPSATGVDPNAVIVDPTDRFVFVANLTSNSVSASPTTTAF